MLVVKSAVKKIINDNGKRMSRQAMEALDTRVRIIIEGAVRASGNHKTITDTEILSVGRT